MILPGSILGQDLGMALPNSLPRGGAPNDLETEAPGHVGHLPTLGRR